MVSSRAANERCALKPMTVRTTPSLNTIKEVFMKAVEKMNNHVNVKTTAVVCVGALPDGDAHSQLSCPLDAELPPGVRRV